MKSRSGMKGKQRKGQRTAFFAAWIKEWRSKRRMKLNPGKTQVKLCDCNNWENEGTTLQTDFGNSTLQQRSENRFPGLTFQWRLQWTWHIEETNKKMRAKVAQLHKLRTRGISTSNLTKRYKELIRPHMGSCKKAWANIPISLLQKLQTTREQALRTILGKPPWTRIEELHKVTRTPLVANLLWKLTQQARINQKHRKKLQVQEQLEIAEGLKGP